MKSDDLKNCIIDCRVSSTKQTEGASLEDQEIIGRNVASRNQWNILKVFSKPFSASLTERDDFDEIVSFIKASKKPVHYYICKSIDRFTRGGVIPFLEMKLRLEKLGVEVIDSYGIIQPNKNSLDHLGVSYPWSQYSPSEASQILEALRGKQEVRDILTRMIGAEIALVREGYKVRQPHDGFLNKRVYVEGKKKIIQIPDPERARYFTEIFNLRTSGTLSDSEIVVQINSMGYRSKTKKRWAKKKAQIIGYTEGKPLTVKQMQRIITRTIYAGVVCEKWTNYQPINAQYDGLVSIEVFNKANRGKVFIKKHPDKNLQIIYDYSPFGKVRIPRLRNNPLYPYKNIILCPFCQKPFLGSAPKGKSKKGFPTYHCARNHKYYGVSKKKFEEDIEYFLSHIKFTPEFLDTLKVALLDELKKQTSKILIDASHMNRNVAVLKAQQAEALKRSIVTQYPVVRVKLEEQVEKLELQIKQALNNRNRVEIDEVQIKSFIQNTKYLMEHPIELFTDNSDMLTQRTLFGLLFHEFPTYQKILNGTPILTRIFTLSEEFKRSKSLDVSQLGLEWNTWVKIMNQWNEVFDML